MSPPAPALARRSRTPLRFRGDTGSGTVWVLSVCAIVWFTATAMVLVASVRADRQRASSAADLAALAGARDAAQGAAPACASARATASANGARLTACRLNGTVIDTTVELPARLGAGSLSAAARAGPADHPPAP
ncbi:secretion/DNA translocation related TadE-like protein [Murinocardiopsis flavida]|uniref:Secretion/DNA translocation related TadE-like protein n=1 Tax=Murinocardiopsis flavida TaxID=645275 RepID=A0A2P8DQE6_9ACTN|nr:Rv3654c family TadE-like protein [Murinocardiopsis flavida]PSK99418.1 secretion/DNA translocation related TadE-like protein [Murinocardiopsis flavida]